MLNQPYHPTSHYPPPPPRHDICASLYRTISTSTALGFHPPPRAFMVEQPMVLARALSHSLPSSLHSPGSIPSATVSSAHAAAPPPHSSESATTHPPVPHTSRAAMALRLPSPQSGLTGISSSVSSAYSVGTGRTYATMSRLARSTNYTIATSTSARVESVNARGWPVCALDRKPPTRTGTCVRFFFLALPLARA